MDAAQRLYFSAVLRIIAKTISAANMPTLTEIEAGDRARDWMDVLYGHVPESRLEQAFRQAVHAHGGPFPVNCYEIIEAYRTIVAIGQPENHSSTNKAEADAAAAMCDFCHGSGIRFKRDADGRVLGAMPGKPCDHRPMGETPPLYSG